ncbi:hypothetical protein [Salmonella enterica]
MDTTLTLYDLSSKVVSEEHYPLPERTQETLETRAAQHHRRLY